MKPKIKVKIGIDIAMIMFFLFIMHHVLNHRWIRNQRKARWSVLRIWQIILVIWVLVGMSLHLGLHCDYGIVCMCWALYE